MRSLRTRPSLATPLLLCCGGVLALTVTSAQVSQQRPPTRQLSEAAAPDVAVAEDASGASARGELTELLRRVRTVTAESLRAEAERRGILVVPERLRLSSFGPGALVAGAPSDVPTAEAGATDAPAAVPGAYLGLVLLAGPEGRWRVRAPGTPGVDDATDAPATASAIPSGVYGVRDAGDAVELVDAHGQVIARVADGTGGTGSTGWTSAFRAIVRALDPEDGL